MPRSYWIWSSFWRMVPLLVSASLQTGASPSQKVLLIKISFNVLAAFIISSACSLSTFRIVKRRSESVLRYSLNRIY